ncbi:MAG: primosomal protein N', partial [Patescibacteria group bacterium]
SYLLSLHTGETLPIPETCPKCSSTNLFELGAGTQRLESLLSELFPEARILRADADTLKNPESMRLLLRSMHERNADILLGTQSVVKGLDLPGVTLAAVLLADIGLSLPHFRAGERIFQLLTQLTGRAGRKEPGEVIIQTFRPKAMEIALAANHDVRGYLERELAARKVAHYPPDTNLVRILFSGPTAKEQSLQYVNILKVRSEIQISRSPTLFSGGRDWQVLVRGKNVRELLKAKKMPEFHGTIDVDPVECL